MLKMLPVFLFISAVICYPINNNEIILHTFFTSRLYELSTIHTCTAGFTRVFESSKRLDFFTLSHDQLLLLATKGENIVTCKSTNLLSKVTGIDCSASHFRGTKLP